MLHYPQPLSLQIATKYSNATKTQREVAWQIGDNNDAASLFVAPQDHSALSIPLTILPAGRIRHQVCFGGMGPGSVVQFQKFPGRYAVWPLAIWN